MNQKINWAQKLSSRKFWAMILGFITALLTAFNVDNMTTQQVVAVVSSFGVIIAYILGEGSIDSARIKAGKETTDEE